MKRVQLWLLLALIALGLGYSLRGQIREFIYSASQPALPSAIVYIAPTSTQPEATPTSTAPIVRPDKAPAPTPKPVPTDPLVWTGDLPSELNLKIPFLLQAPKQNWVQPFEDACEEASLIMVDAFYRGRTANYEADEGIDAILKVVAFEDAEYGYNKDTTSADVAKTAQEFYGYSKTIVTDATEAKIKAVLANGYPVIVPAYGKALLNPNFRNGGPEYHMLVIKGYTKDGQWITNDPGTRRGADYIYPKQRLLDAIHDFNAEDMRQGRKLMIVVLPKN